MKLLFNGAKEERLMVIAQLQSGRMKCRNLGVVMDSDVSFSNHIKTIIIQLTIILWMYEGRTGPCIDLYQARQL